MCGILAAIGEMTMKKFIAAALLIVLTAIPASAGLFGGNETKFGTKGAIPNAEPVEYRGLKITSEGANIVIINRSTDKTVTFSGALAFVDNRKNEVGDFFIEKVTLAPQEQKQLTNIFLKGDAKKCRAAETLNWTIYTLEVK
jgi:hypothetical protein